VANWNIDWETRVGEPLAKASGAADVQYNFGRAAEERWLGSITHFTVGSEGDFALRFVNAPGSNDSGIAAVEATWWALQNRYLRPGYDPEGNRWFNTVSFLGANDSTFDNDTGRIQRRWRRRIWSTSNAGSTGQRAIFEDHRPFDVSTNTRGAWYAVDDTDGAFNTYVTTPDAQRKHSGKLFEHNGTTWVLASDQSTPADIVTQAAAKRWWPGSIVHGDDLNELRDRINDLTATWAVDDPDSDGSAGAFGDGSMWRFNSSNSSTPPSGGSSGLVYSDGRSRFGSSGISSADADADYAADVDYDDSGVRAGALTGVGGTPANSWTTERHRNEIVTATVHLPDTGLTREITFWVWAVGFTAFPGTTVEFDAYSDGVIEQRWHAVGGPVSQSVKEVDSGDDSIYAGSLGAAPSPWPAGTDVARGWTLKDVGITVNWAVSGGFTYTSGAGF
jgi:hypothetical protein